MAAVVKADRWAMAARSIPITTPATPSTPPHVRGTRPTRPRNRADLTRRTR